MPTERIPLVGVPNTRNVDPINSFTKDQIYKGVLFDVISNPQTGRKVIYANKRPGFKTGSTINSAYAGRECEDNYGFNDLTGPCTAWDSGSSTTELYIGTTFIGQIANTTCVPLCITKAIINGEEYYLIAAGSSGMYYIAKTGYDSPASYTGDSHSNTTIDNISSTAGLVVGQLLEPGAGGMGIVAGTRVASVAANSITTTIAVTNTVSGAVIVNSRMSKIIDADAPTAVIGPMIEMDGYVFVAQQDSRRIYQSDLNSITSWTSTSFISANLTTSYLLGISRLKNNIIGHTTDSLQFFYNAGNATGSVLSPQKDSVKRFTNMLPTGVSSAFTATFIQYSYIDDFLFVIYDGVYMLSPNGVQDISDPIVRKVIANTARTSLAIRAFKFLGSYYVVIFAGSAAFLYDLKSGLWTQTGWTSIAFMSKHMGNCVYFAVDGRLHTYPWTGTGQTPVYQDDGAAYTMTIQTAKNDHGTKRRKFSSRLELVGSDVQSSGTTTVEKSDDDGATWQTLGTFDMTSSRPSITRCGSYIDRQYRLTHSANTAWRAMALDETFEVASR